MNEIEAWVGHDAYIEVCFRDQCQSGCLSRLDISTDPCSDKANSMLYAPATNVN